MREDIDEVHLKVKSEGAPPVAPPLSPPCFPKSVVGSLKAASMMHGTDTTEHTTIFWVGIRVLHIIATCPCFSVLQEKQRVRNNAIHHPK